MWSLKRIGRNAMAIAGVLCTPSLLEAQHVIDFGAIGCVQPQVRSFPSPFTIDGFTFTNGSGRDFASWCSSAIHYTGSAGLFNSGGNTTATLTKVGGGVFGLQSIDLAPLYAGQIFFASIDFTGTLQNQSTVTQTFFVPTNSGRPALTTYVFGANFSNVISVSWNQGGNDLHQFDNVTVATVPEPSSMALLAGGLLGMTWMLVRRRRSA